MTDLLSLLRMSVELAKLTRHKGDPVSPLSSSDRCDRCGAAAVYEVTKKVESFQGAVYGMGSLLFCSHHWRKHFPSMAEEWAITNSNPQLAPMGDP